MSIVAVILALPWRRPNMLPGFATPWLLGEGA
jgi:hypothetical protein